MRHGKKPDQLSLVRQQYATTNLRVKKWVKRLLGDPSALPTDLPDEELALVVEEVARRNGDDLQATPFRESLIRTTPAMSAPDWTDNGEDLGHVFVQPEMRAFWYRLAGPRTGRGPKMNVPALKALLAYQAMTGTSAHVDTNYSALANDSASMAVFQKLERDRLDRLGRTDDPSTVALTTYKAMVRQIPRLAPNVWDLALQANVAMLKQLRELHPEVGKRLLIDCCAVPAWAQQRGAGAKDNPRRDAREAKLRKHTPEAGFISQHYTRNGKIVAPYEKRPNGKPAGHGKQWRGYLLAVLVDNASGLPIVWSLYDASLGEHMALPLLLSDLHRLWPDVGAEMIAGDSLWDTNAACRLCEVEYGIAPIFRIHPSDAAKRAWNYLDEDVARDDEIDDVEAAA